MLKRKILLRNIYFTPKISSFVFVYNSFAIKNDA